MVSCEDSFVGERFTTGYDSTLKVVGVSDRKSGRRKVYQIRCSVCSEDVELFPKLFESLKGDLLRGQVPCGCSVHPRWTKDQYEVRIIRECEKRRISFLGFVEEGKKVSSKTKLKLRCIVDNEVWSSTSITGFFARYGCPECKKNITKSVHTKPDSFHIKQFITTEAFPERTVFIRNKKRKALNGRSSYWDVICPICSKDEYVTKGLCSGVFTAEGSALKRGLLSCRCSYKYHWTKEQREYQIKRICESEGINNTSWSKIGYINNKSSFRWSCKEGHYNTTSVDNFLQGSRCMQCAIDARNWGYYHARKDEEDTLYLIKLCKGKEIFIKIGRTFDLDRRIMEFERVVCEVEVLSIVQDTHKNVYELEQTYHKALKGLGYHYKPSIEFGGDTECFNITCLEVIVDT